MQPGFVTTAGNDLSSIKQTKVMMRGHWFPSSAKKYSPSVSSSSCQAVEKEAKLRARPGAAHPVLDFSFQWVASTVFSAMETSPSV